MTLRLLIQPTVSSAGTARRNQRSKVVRRPSRDGFEDRGRLPLRGLRSTARGGFCEPGGATIGRAMRRVSLRHDLVDESWWSPGRRWGQDSAFAGAPPTQSAELTGRGVNSGSRTSVADPTPRAHATSTIANKESRACLPRLFHMAARGLAATTYGGGAIARSHEFRENAGARRAPPGRCLTPRLGRPLEPPFPGIAGASLAGGRKRAARPVRNR
jgi:hypothetical protein